MKLPAFLAKLLAQPAGRPAPGVYLDMHGKIHIDRAVVFPLERMQDRARTLRQLRMALDRQKLLEQKRMAKGLR